MPSSRTVEKRKNPPAHGDGNQCQPLPRGESLGHPTQRVANQPLGEQDAAANEQRIVDHQPRDSILLAEALDGVHGVGRGWAREAGDPAGGGGRAAGTQTLTTNTATGCVGKVGVGQCRVACPHAGCPHVDKTSSRQKKRVSSCPRWVVQRMRTPALGCG